MKIKSILQGLWSVLLTSVVVAWIIYAAAGNRITTLTDTAASWSVLTHEWVNAVNQKLNTVFELVDEIGNVVL